MVPVFKNVGERSTAKNYHPVSILSVASKVFKKLVNNRIVDHLEKCGLFSSSQYGFKSTRSTADFNNTGAVDMEMGGSFLEEKSSFKMLGLYLSSKLDWGSYIISIAKNASKKIGALICSMKFLSPKVPLYLYKSTI